VGVVHRLEVVQVQHDYAARPAAARRLLYFSLERVVGLPPIVSTVRKSALAGCSIASEKAGAFK
jgi:hypothetical protein